MSSKIRPHWPTGLRAIHQCQANVKQALLLVGSVSKHHGDYYFSIQLLETGLFDKAAFTNLHVAVHPEGNRDIDPKGGHANVYDELSWK